MDGHNSLNRLNNNMHHDGEKALSDLKKQLQKTFSLLGQFRNEIKEIEAVARPCIQTVANLTEQFQCCSAVRVSSLPETVDFRDVKQKLLFKIALEMNENIEKLQTQVCRYEEYSNRLGRQYDQCMTKYNKCFSTEQYQLLNRSPLYPSITDMFEWIEVSERSVRETYLCKRFIVDTFNPDQPGIADSLGTSWRECDKDLNNKIDEFLALTNHFMELAIS